MHQKAPPPETGYTSRLAHQAVAEMLTRRAIAQPHVSKPKKGDKIKSKPKKTARTHHQDTTAADEKRAVNHNVKRLVGRVLLDESRERNGGESVMRRVIKMRDERVSKASRKGKKGNGKSGVGKVSRGGALTE